MQYELYDPETNRFLVLLFNGSDLDISIEEEGVVKGNVIIEPEEVEDLMNFLLDILIEPVSSSGYQRRPFGNPRSLLD
jgi:hypothetical protein